MKLYSNLYIYKTEAFEAPTIFHVSTVLKKKNINEKIIIISKEKRFLKPDKILSTLLPLSHPFSVLPYI